MRAGTHVAASNSPTVAAAGEHWITSSEANGLERATIDQYRQHLKYHLAPYVGSRKLAELSARDVRELEDRLRDDGRSPVMVRKVLVRSARSWPTRKSVASSAAMSCGISAAAGARAKRCTPRSAPRAS